MIPTRSASWSASSRYWVVRKTVAPSAFSFATSSQIALRLTGSRPVVGSSRKRHVGLVHERRGKVEPTAHPARVRAHAAIGGVLQADSVEQRLRAALALSARQAVKRCLHPDQLAPGHQRVERGLLQRDADRLAHAARLGHDVVPGDPRGCRPSAAAGS